MGVDMQPTDAAIGDDFSGLSLRILMQHATYMHHGTTVTSACVDEYAASGGPHLCEYEVPIHMGSELDVCTQLAQHFVSAPPAPEEWVTGYDNAEGCERCPNPPNCTLEVGGPEMEPM